MINAVPASSWFDSCASPEGYTTEKRATTDFVTLISLTQARKMNQVEKQDEVKTTPTQACHVCQSQSLEQVVLVDLLKFLVNIRLL